MNNLNIINQGGQLLVDSREVAVMTNVRHSDLMRSISGFTKILENAELRSQDFFIPSVYKTEGNHKTYDRYLLTKKGCDMVANKMTCEKGVLFTAAYVTKFEEMEQQIRVSAAPPSYMIDNPIDRAQKWIEEQKEKLMLKEKADEYENKAKYVDLILQSKSTVTTSQIAKDYGLSAQELNAILHDERIQYKQNKQWLLYQKHTGKGYTKSHTIDIVHRNGQQDVKMNTRWTQKGRLFIHEILEKRGIVANMDKPMRNAE